jgi:hypothetical protein
VGATSQAAEKLFFAVIPSEARNPSSIKPGKRGIPRRETCLGMTAFRVFPRAVQLRHQITGKNPALAPAAGEINSECNSKDKE